MKIIVNGMEHSFQEKITLQEIIKILNIVNENIIAEVNGVIVTKDEFANTIIEENSVIELVKFVGGG